MLTIVFDLDGTLIDTAPDLISTLNFILSGERLPPVAYNDGRRMIGGGILAMIKRALNAEGCDPPRAHADVGLAVAAGQQAGAAAQDQVIGRRHQRISLKGL